MYFPYCGPRDFVGRTPHKLEPARAVDAGFAVAPSRLMAALLEFG